MSGPHLMGTLGVHHNIPVSDTELTLSLGIDFISTPMAIDKLDLIPVNSRAITNPLNMSLKRDIECTPAVIIEIVYY